MVLIKQKDTRVIRARVIVGWNLKGSAVSFGETVAMGEYTLLLFMILWIIINILIIFFTTL